VFNPILSTSSSGDRNTLFAVLAMHLDFLEPERFPEIWKEWKSQALMPWPDYLVARKIISGDERQMLSRLMERKLSRHGGQVEPCLEDFGELARKRLARAATGSSGNEPDGQGSAANTHTVKSAAPGRWTRLRGFRWRRALVGGVATLLVCVGVGTLLLIPEGSGKESASAEDDALSMPGLQQLLPPVGMPVSPEVLAANDRERAKQYPKLLTRAQMQWRSGRLREARSTLEQQLPPRLGSRDSRNFEWYYLQHLFSGGRFDIPTGPAMMIGLFYTPDGSRLLTVGEAGQTRVWDAGSGDLIRRWERNLGSSQAAALSMDGRLLVTATRNNAVQVWDVASAGLLRSIQSATEGVLRDVAIRPDGRQCASGGSDGMIYIWELTSGTEVASFLGHSKGITSITYSPDGQMVASASLDGTVRLWQAVEGGSEIRSFQLSEGSLSGPSIVRFNRDGSRLAASSGKTVQVWDPTSKESIATFKAHREGPIHSLCFSPDGTRVVSAAADGFVHIWETDSGSEFLSIQAGSATLFTFSPDGANLAANVNDRAAVGAAGNNQIAIWETRRPTPEQQDRREARAFVEPLFRRTLDRREVAKLVQESPRLSAAVRKTALDLAERVELDPEVLNNTSWFTVREPGLSPGAYTRALHMAEEAVRKEPRRGYYVNTLGVAQYRIGHYAEALKTLLQSSQLNSSPLVTGRTSGFTRKNRNRSGSVLPADVAFLAMTYQRLSQKEEARDELERLRSLMEGQNELLDTQLDEIVRDQIQESLAFLREAEELIDKAQPAGAAGGPPIR
jgi:hypothetical protein